jgi:ABC-type transporter Mla maintaining outer membrane lipid asymmetry ATPase subunit MlaF
METMLEHLMQPTPKMDRAQRIDNQLGATNMANTHVVQEVFSIVDELATILENMLGTFEGNVEDGNNKCE